MAKAESTGSVVGKSANGIVSPVRLAHVVFKTSHMKAMLAWYRTVLNGTIAYEDDGIAFLAYDDEHHRIAFIQIPELSKAPPAHQGLHHVAFTYAALGQLLDNHERLSELGIDPQWSVNHGPTTSMYYADPDGNNLEFQVDNYDTVEESGKFFFTEAFSTNPIGVDFDPVEMRNKLRAGEPEDKLKQRPPSGPRGVETIPLN